MSSLNWLAAGAWLGALSAAKPVLAQQPLVAQEQAAPANAAAADVANSSAAEPNKPALSDELEAAALSDEEAGVLDAATSGQLLKLYGFGDVGYRHYFVAKDSAWFQFLNREPSFFLGNLNIYVDAQLSARWRALAEVRFSYLPHGAPDTSLAPPFATRQDFEVADYTDFSRSHSFGGIVLERATLEYNPFTFLTVSAGHWLTPYGIWNVDHGSPVIIGVAAPFIIGAELLPASQVGLLAQGTTPMVGTLELGYALGLSNGRIDQVPFEDLDADKALTARVSVTQRSFGEGTLGFTFYYGRSTRGVNELFFADGTPKSRLVVDEQFDEVSYAADLKWGWQNLHFQAELVGNDRNYTERGRPLGRSGGLVPDKRNLGGYALLGYRTPFVAIMPYGKLEYSGEPQLQSLGLADQITVWTGGLNFRPDPRVVLKAEYSFGQFSGGGPNNFSDSPLQGLDMQAAWAF